MILEGGFADLAQGAVPRHKDNFRIADIRNSHVLSDDDQLPNRNDIGSLAQ